MISWIKAHTGWLSGLVILLVICLFFLYAWFDSRVTITYMLQEHQDQRREIEALQKLLLETGKRMSRSEIEQLIIKHMGKDHIKEESRDELSVDGGILFIFKGDSLVSVKSYGE